MIQVWETDERTLRAVTWVSGRGCPINHHRFYELVLITARAQMNVPLKFLDI
jgi:hypothetical protein